MSVDVYFFPTMNGRKVTIALEEMGIDYVLKRVDVRNGQQFTPEFLSISPNNKIPAIVDDEGEGGSIVDHDGPDGRALTMFESGAILQYLGRKSGLFYPADERARCAVDQWLMWQMSGLGPMTGQVAHFKVYAPLLTDDPGQLAYSRKRYHDEVNRLHGILDRRLSDVEYVAGAYSIADMAIWPWLDSLAFLGHDMNAFPAMKRWYEMVGARPPVQRGWAAGKGMAEDTILLSEEERRASTRMLFGQTAQSAHTHRASSSG